MKARLLVTDYCERNCPGCCNKDRKFEPSIMTTFEGVEEILLTGGEPLLFTERLITLIRDLKQACSAKIYVYTACIEKPSDLAYTMMEADGICLTLHTSRDVKLFNLFQSWFRGVMTNFAGKSLRLNIFKEAGYPKNTDGWKVKKDMEWIKDCPLPAGEEFFRLPSLWKKPPARYCD